MTLKTLGMGIAKLVTKKRPGNIYSKLVKTKTKSKAEQTFDNVYKYSDKKEKVVKSMNEFLKKKKRQASPTMVDKYHKVMTSDPQVKPGKK